MFQSAIPSNLVKFSTQELPSLTIISPLTGSFEIELNGQLLFSKMETSGFPYEDDVSLVPINDLWPIPHLAIFEPVFHLRVAPVLFRWWMPSRKPVKASRWRRSLRAGHHASSCNHVGPTWLLTRALSPWLHLSPESSSLLHSAWETLPLFFSTMCVQHSTVQYLHAVRTCLVLSGERCWGGRREMHSRALRRVLSHVYPCEVGFWT